MPAMPAPATNTAPTGSADFPLFGFNCSLIVVP
jgi:hypothetical protein